jgi:hypothetical protein
MRKSEAFSLIEVLISLVILSTSLLLVSGYYGSMHTRLLKVQEKQSYLLAVKRELYKVLHHPEKNSLTFPIKKTVEGRALRIETTLDELDAKSDLSDFEGRIVKITSHGSWKSPYTKGGQAEYKLIGFIAHTKEKET